MKKLLSILLVAVLILSVLPAASAETATAADITKDTAISGSGYSGFGFLSDGDIKTYHKSSGNTTITLENAAGIHSLYLMFDLEYGEYTITDNTTGKSITAGQHRFLHEYIALESPATSLTIRFENGAVRLSLSLIHI